MMTDLFGIWGIAIGMVVLFSLAGGYTGWNVYRLRTVRAARDLEPRP
jgi:hypothetical protein